MFRFLRRSSALLYSMPCSEKAFCKFFSEDLLNAKKEVIVKNLYITPCQAVYWQRLFTQLIEHSIAITIHTRNEA